ncbi:bifunctional diguanylate cyclase/phosphodiesterase [Halalkalibacter okhensis]|uniref:bifunctional diguanylate cyclase/phosphodiesterase n=1 Tax=Halalkalibacter okhensis TaxID=333138 RepID=UPI00068B47B5|nr:GGDEF domain-containing protein [Halalkalibacter okhensis]
MNDLRLDEKKGKLFQWQNQIVQMIAANEPLSNILNELVSIVEIYIPGSICSIQLYNKKTNTLEKTTSRTLPEEYIRAIDGIKAGPNVGSCGTAVYEKQTVIVTNVNTDPLWKHYRELPIKHGLKSCWSVPIFSPNQEVVGTFSLYYKEKREPTELQLHQLNEFAQLSGIAIDYRSSQEEIYRIKHTDPLTGLANASQFKIDAHQALEHAKAKKETVATFFIDLNRFNVINNIGGYDVGDDILVAVTDRLLKSLPPTVLLTRWNSDKFIVLLEDSTPEAVHSFSERIIDVLSIPFIRKEHDFIITISVGVSSFPNDSKTIDELIRHSEAAMNEAKLLGINQYRVYSSSIADRLTNRVHIEKELRQAIEDESFILHYQPQVSLSTEEIIGVEALIRWEHSTMGLVQPSNFIPIAEETGLIMPLGEWVLKTACQQMKEWEREGRPSIRLSVNLSSVQFRQKNLVSKIKQIIEETELDPANLVLEVTESTLVNHMKYTIIQLRELQAMGIQIALDDFGTLYSSLSYLKHFPLDIIKIDRSFVRTLLSDSKDIEIVNIIIRLGKSLQLKVLAEGIETKGQAHVLKEHHCHEGQGYLYSKPLPFEQLKKEIS